MSIPSYNVICKAPPSAELAPDGKPCPGKPCPPDGTGSGSHFQTSYVRDTNKNVDIYDKFGKLRYVVELASSLQPPGERLYKVTVAQMVETGLKIFLQIPDGDQYERDYRVAMSNFDACVKKYKSLIDAEMRDFRDIDVYSENIGYEVQKVECCQSCRWCMKTLSKEGPHHNCKPHVIKMQCCCPMNEQAFNYANPFPQMPSHMHPGGWSKLPWQSPEDIGRCKDGIWGPNWDPRKFPSIIFPTVEPLGKCENYTHGDGFLQYGRPPTPPQYQIASNIATAFDPTVSYNPGDLVYYAGKLYQCISYHEAGNWDPDHFMSTTINDALKQKSSIDMLSNYVPNNALSGYEMSEDPRQREIANAVKHLLSALGGDVSLL